MTNSINTHLRLKTYYTVGENIIATTKIRNNYGAIQSFIFSILLLVKLSLLILFAFFLVSVLCYRKVGGAITTWGAIEKSQILLSQYWKNEWLDGTIIISNFDGSNNIFANCRPSTKCGNNTIFSRHWLENIYKRNISLKNYVL